MRRFPGGPVTTKKKTPKPIEPDDIPTVVVRAPELPKPKAPPAPKKD